MQKKHSQLKLSKEKTMTDFNIGKIAFGPGFKDFDKYFVGFDDQFNRLAKMHDDLTKNIPNYPPYNIKKVDDNKYVIELAVAGFGSVSNFLIK